MLKKAFLTVAAICLSFSLTACGGADNDVEKNDINDVTPLNFDNMDNNNRGMLNDNGMLNNDDDGMFDIENEDNGRMGNNNIYRNNDTNRLNGGNGTMMSPNPNNNR